MLVGEGDFNATVAGGLIPVHARVVNGVLDCAALRLEADIVEGAYVAGDVSSSFTGSIVARYDPAAHVMTAGQWSVAEGGAAPPTMFLDREPLPPDANTGTGTWVAAFVGGP